MQMLKKPDARRERATPTTRPSRRSSTRSSPPSRRTETPRCGATRPGSTAGSREAFRLDADEIAASLERVPAQVLDDIAFCQEQVRTFARAQRATMTDLEVETLPGIRLGHRHIPVASVGAYVPGGRYPMVASAHMSIVTAKVAGVERVAACTPPLDGRVPDATVAAMHLAGADEIYVLGGVQALAALALGTETIDPVDFLVGPGNAYVVEAKRRLFGKVGHRPRRRADGDPRRRRRDGRPGDRRRRPARPGRARPGVAGGARHDVAGARARRRCARSRVQLETCPPPRSRRGRGRTTARWSSSTRTTRRSPPPTRTPSSTSRSRPPTRAGTSSGCGTTARSSSARRRPSRTATRRSARTTSSRPAARRATRAGSGSGSSSRPSPSRSATRRRAP